MDGFEVKMSEIGSIINRVEQHLASTTTATTATTANINTASTITAVITDTYDNRVSLPQQQQLGDGQIILPVLDCEEQVVASALHNIHFDTLDVSNENSSNNSNATTVISHCTPSLQSDSTETATANDMNMHAQESSCIDDNDNNNNTGTGMIDLKAYTKFESVLSQLQVQSSDVIRVDSNDVTIGTGGFAKVYKVQLKAQSEICAAKVRKT
jgi:hypothetical protein